MVEKGSNFLVEQLKPGTPHFQLLARILYETGIETTDIEELISNSVKYGSVRGICVERETSVRDAIVRDKESFLFSLPFRIGHGIVNQKSVLVQVTIRNTFNMEENSNENSKWNFTIEFVDLKKREHLNE